MNIDKYKTANDYRSSVRRCRTCIFARGGYSDWTCKCKNKRHSGDLCKTVIAGMLCKQYVPKDMRND